MSILVFGLQWTDNVSAVERMPDIMEWNQRAMQIPPKEDNTDAWDDEEYTPYKGPRHDQFDWKLTKVLGKL